LGVCGDAGGVASVTTTSPRRDQERGVDSSP
jgi:hypothetical protein